MTIAQAHLTAFLSRHQLTDEYLTSAKAHFTPLINQLTDQQQQTQQTITLGLTGSQGSGKTTLGDYLQTVLTVERNLNVVSLSLDDFYLSRKARQDLANTVHPLLANRGVPGTHNVALALQTLKALKKPGRVALPRFNKATDDIVEARHWQTVEGNVDIIIFEGWCLGAVAQTNTKLLAPINTLEANQDAKGIWRHYVNRQLSQHYQNLFAQVDTWAMLKAPSFDCIYQWRLEQEHKLKRQITGLNKRGIMSDQAIKQFVLGFQRITEQLLKTIPQNVEFLYKLDSNRNIV